MPHDQLDQDTVRRLIAQVHATYLSSLRKRHEAVVRRSMFDSAEKLLEDEVVSKWVSRGRQVALVAHHTVSRVDSARDLKTQTQLRRRTRVIEGLQSDRSSWAALAAAHLGRLSRRRVSISAYESTKGDASGGWHCDQFDGVVLQVRGEKHWTFESQQLLTRPGDIMAIPFGLGHDVFTPQESLHLLFVYLQEPLLRLGAGE